MYNHNNYTSTKSTSTWLQEHIIYHIKNYTSLKKVVNRKASLGMYVNHSITVHYNVNGHIVYKNKFKKD